MASLDYRSNPLFTFKECSSCGALYNKSCACSKGGFVGKFVRNPNKTPDSSQRPPHNCPNYGDPVDGLYCRQCALLRKKLEEVWFTICDENEILNTSESSNDNTNVVNAPQEPFVFNQNPGENSSQSPPHIDHHCCYECGDSLDDSLIMEDKHLDTIPETESDELIKSSVEDLVPIPCESEGIPDNMCDVPFHDNSLPLDISKDQFEGIPFLPILYDILL
ncbi:hypothetical protein Tco_1307721 [Tanacetum coccineum]